MADGRQQSFVQEEVGFCLLGRPPGPAWDSVCPLSSGKTVIGSAARDISLQGPGLAPEHCYIENVRGTLTLHPCGNICSIDGLPVRQPTRLTQGKVCCPQWEAEAMVSVEKPGLGALGAGCEPAVAVAMVTQSQWEAQGPLHVPQEHPQLL